MNSNGMTYKYDSMQVVFSLVHIGDRPSRPVEKLLVWNHDDKPLKSDVAQQAINLARGQQFLGSQSGIE